MLKLQKNLIVKYFSYTTAIYLEMKKVMSFHDNLNLKNYPR